MADSNEGRPEPSEWLSAREAMTLLGLDRGPFYAKVARGVIPAFRLGRTLRFRRVDIEAALVPVQPKS
jgi:excisionase family DNA binding protein